MKTTPKTIKSTLRTRLVDLGDRAVKVKKSHTQVTLSGQNSDGNKWGEKSRRVSRSKWHCKELGLVNLDRLAMEKELLNLCGWDLQFHNCSLEEWRL